VPLASLRHHSARLGDERWKLVEKACHWSGKSGKKGVGEESQEKSWKMAAKTVQFPFLIQIHQKLSLL